MTLETDRIRFGRFELDLRGAELRRDGRVVRIQQQPFKVLAMLAARGGELVTREELQRELWSEQSNVDFEQGLNFCIRQIRLVLNDQAEAPRYVETLPRRGYRFVAPIEPARRPADGAAPVAPAVPPASRSRRGRAILGAAVVALAVTAAAWVWRVRATRTTPGPRPAILAVLPFENPGADPAASGPAMALTRELLAALRSMGSARPDIVVRSVPPRLAEGTRDLDGLSRELGADYLVEGSLLQAAERVRITVTLLDLRDRSQVWSGTYERTLGNVEQVQREIARTAAREIGFRIAAAPTPKGATPRSFR